MNTSRFSFVVLSLLAGSTFAACADVSEAESDEQTGVATQHLYLNGPKWTNGLVPVCWEGGGTRDYDGSLVANAATLRANVQNYIEDSWGRVANLTFVDWGACPSNPQHYTTIRWASNDPRAATDGLGDPGSTGVRRIDISPFSTDLQYRAIHEMGHALGMDHEQQRPDAFDRNGNAIQCKPGDNNSPSAGGTYLTPYDYDSIMNYCARRHDLSRYDIVGIQVAYGRKAPGSIAGLHNRCVDIPIPSGGGNPSPGTALQAYNCHGSDNQTWLWTSQGQLETPAIPNAFMDDRTGAGLSGDPLQIYWQHMPASTNQKFSFDNVSIRAMGETCLTVPGANYTNGNIIQIEGCQNGPLGQQWSVSADGTIRNGSFCLDVPGGSTALHTAIQIHTCNGGSNQRFTFTNRGEITFGNMCVDVAGGGPTDHSQLQLYTCKSESDPTRMNQRFHLNGELHNASKCVDITGGQSFDRAPLQIFDCTGGANQNWDYYFRRN